MGDLVEGKGNGLQGREWTKGINRYLCQSVVIQPQVAQGGQSIKTVLRYARDVVRIQSTGGKDVRKRVSLGVGNFRFRNKLLKIKSACGRL